MQLLFADCPGNDFFNISHETLVQELSVMNQVEFLKTRITWLQVVNRRAMQYTCLNLMNKRE